MIASVKGTGAVLISRTPSRCPIYLKRFLLLSLSLLYQAVRLRQGQAEFLSDLGTWLPCFVHCPHFFITVWVLGQSRVNAVLLPHQLNRLPGNSEFLGDSFICFQGFLQSDQLDFTDSCHNDTSICSDWFLGNNIQKAKTQSNILRLKIGQKDNFRAHFPKTNGL
jgi:hypothetical protein